MNLQKYLNLLVIIFALITSCGGDEPEPTPEPPGPQKIDVESITLSHNLLEMVPDGTQQLTATVTPTNATNKTVTWESSNKSVATVSSSGLVKAITDGTATIRATADGKSASCEVIVKYNPAVIVEGESATVDLTIGASLAQLEDEIEKANEEGVTEYKLVGDCKNLGITSAKNAKNVFANTNAEVIDMSEVTGWPTITKSALYNSNSPEDASYMTEELPGVPAGLFHNVGSTLQELILPAEVQAIGEKAFCELASLEKLTAPGIKIIGAQALQATSIKELNLPNATTLGRAWSYYNRNLTKVTLPNATYMGQNGLAVCPQLKSVNIPNLTTLEDFVLTECIALTDVNLPLVKTIKNGAFCKCTALTTISIPQADIIGNTNGNYVGPFYGCTSLTNVSLPNATMIGRMSFEGCTALKEISLPLVTILHYNAFYGCSALSSINLPEVVSLEEGALQNCKSLKTISLPKATEIGENAISNNRKLQTLSLTANGSINLGKQNGTFDSNVIDLILNANKKSEVQYDYMWKGMSWLSISYQ